MEITSGGQALCRGREASQIQGISMTTSTCISMVLDNTQLSQIQPFKTTVHKHILNPKFVYIQNGFLCNPEMYAFWSQKAILFTC